MTEGRFLRISELFNSKAQLTETVSVKGWAWHIRKQGNLIFLDLYDGTTWKVLQITFSKKKMEQENFEQVNAIFRGASIIVHGEVIDDKRAPFGKEMKAQFAEIIHPSQENYDQLVPSDAGTETRLNKRYIAIRNPKTASVLRIRDKVLRYTREFFSSRGAVEVTPPTIVQAQAEGGAELFEVNYFKRKAYLTQSSQLYLETAIFALRDVFSIAPSYRAEKSRTRRHLCEYLHCEGEYAFMSYEELLNYLEDYIIFVIKKLKDNDTEIIKMFNPDLKIPKKPFPRINYKEALEKLQARGFDIHYGDDISDAPERELVNEFGTPIILQHFPVTLKPFYHKINQKNPEVTNSADFIFPGIGEIIGAGERETDLESMLARMKRMDPPINAEDYDWYLALRKFGSVPHSGFGLGLERFLTWLLNLEHIRDASLYPRLINRLSP